MYQLIYYVIYNQKYFYFLLEHISSTTKCFHFTNYVQCIFLCILQTMVSLSKLVGDIQKFGWSSGLDKWRYVCYDLTSLFPQV